MGRPESYYNDLIGKRFGRLTILKIKREYKKNIKAVCSCDCGNIKEIQLEKVVSGSTKSCGCLKKEQDAVRRFGYYDPKVTDTLCWECSRSGNECSWLRDFTPVKGWKATRYDYITIYKKTMKNVKRTGKGYCITDSYIVEECPLFVKRKKREEKLPSGQFTDSENRQ